MIDRLSQCFPCASVARCLPQSNPFNSLFEKASNIARKTLINIETWDRDDVKRYITKTKLGIPFIVSGLVSPLIFTTISPMAMLAVVVGLVAKFSFGLDPATEFMDNLVKNVRNCHQHQAYAKALSELKTYAENEPTTAEELATELLHGGRTSRSIYEECDKVVNRMLQNRSTGWCAISSTSTDTKNLSERLYQIKIWDNRMIRLLDETKKSMFPFYIGKNCFDDYISTREKFLEKISTEHQMCQDFLDNSKMAKWLAGR